MVCFLLLPSPLPRISNDAAAAAEFIVFAAVE